MKTRSAMQRREWEAHPEGFGERPLRTATDRKNPASHRDAAPFLVFRAARGCCGDAHACARLTDWERTKSATATTTNNH